MFSIKFILATCSAMTEKPTGKSNADVRTEITRASLLARNTIWNTLGIILPLIMGLFAMPFLIHGLGTERFGVLTIAWMVIGYFSIFDFGLGRALTKLVAEKLGGDDHSSIPILIWTGLALMGCAGLIGSMVVALLSEQMAFRWLNIPDSLQPESLNTFYILAASIPFVIATTGFRGVLEAYQKFAIINIIRVPLGLLTFLGPLAVLPFSVSLDVIVIVLLLGRVVGAYAYYYYCIKTVPELMATVFIDKAMIKPLLSFGGWMTLGNIIGPLMVYLDRFLIGSLLTMAAVAYYAAPYEMVTKLWLVPMGLIGVLFPAFSTMLISDKKRAALYFIRTINLIFYSMLPCFIVINLFAYEGMDLWLGVEFAEKSSDVVVWLSIGVFLNCLARVPAIMVQSAGRPDLPAKLYLVELPFYLAALWYALEYYGIEGAAFVWSLRVFVDTLAFLFIASEILPDVNKDAFKIFLKVLVAIAILLSVTLVSAVLLKVIVLFILNGMIIFAALKWGIFPEDRIKLMNILSRLTKSNG